MEDTIENLVSVDQEILKRRLKQEKTWGDGDKIFIGDFRPNNLDQLGCKCYDPNSDEACKLAVVMYDKALEGMVDSFCKKHGYFVNSNKTKIIKR